MIMFMIFFGMLIGGCFAAQAAINSRLSKNTPTTFNASLIAFTVGAILLFVLVLIFDFDKLTKIDFTFPLYVYIGGAICGVIFNVSNVFLFKNIGASATSFFTITSQILVGAIFDAIGFLNLPVQELTIKKFMGIALMILSSYLLSKTNKKASPHPKNKVKQGWWYLLACVVGVFSPLQSILNGRLRVATGSPIIAAFISFAGGVVLLTIITLLVQKKIVLPKTDINGVSLPWWIYTGGIFGILVVGGTTIIIGELGSVLTTSLFLTGQLITSMIIDHFGMFGMEKKEISIKKICVAGIMVISLFIFV